MVWTNKKLNVAKEIILDLEKNHCTVAEAREILAFASQEIQSSATVQFNRERFNKLHSRADGISVTGGSSCTD